MHGSQVMPTDRLRYSKNIFHMHTPHNTQATVGNRMRTSFTQSDGHCSSLLCLVYIPTSTYTYHLILKLLQTSGCTRGLQMMPTVWAHYLRTHIHTHHLIHKLYKLLLTSLSVHSSQIMLAVRIHNPNCICQHTHTTTDIRLDAWFTSDVNRSNPQSRGYIAQIHHVILQLLSATGCMRGSQVMHTFPFHYPICKLQEIYGCPRSLHVMYSVYHLWDMHVFWLI